MQLTVKNKIIGGFCLVLAMAIITGLVGLTSSGRVIKDTNKVLNHYLKFKDLSRQISIAMLQARRSEKDYFLRFDDKYIEKVGESVETINTLSAGVDSLEYLPPDAYDQAQKISSLVGEYYNIFLQVVEDYRQKGSRDAGIVGRFRQKVHEIESKVKEAEALQLEVDMLTLRRHEKDYMLRGDRNYVDKLSAGVKRFKSDAAESKLSAPEKELLTGLADDYEQLFLQVVNIDDVINNQIEKFRTVIHTVEPLIEKSVNLGTSLAQEETDQLHDTIKRSNILMIGVLLLAIAVSATLAFFITKSIIQPLNRVVEMIKDMAQGEGDLTVRLNVTSKDEFGELARWFNSFVGKLRSIIKQVIDSTAQLNAASTQISSTAEELAAGSQEQQAQLSEVATSMEQMSVMILESSKNAAATQDNANHANTAAGNGQAKVSDTIAGIEGIATIVNSASRQIGALEKQSKDIGDVIQVIDDIADQTNLLALNANIEAARAGDAGRGFAVVADEVRKLAERTVSATAEIGGKIKKIQTDVAESVAAMSKIIEQSRNGQKIASESGTALEDISESILAVNQAVTQIASATEQQSTGVEQISRNIENVSSVARQAATGAEQLAASAEELSGQVESLDRLMGQFRV
ncbi:MAG: methyl-accepting chemotaxis protein [FCB group bacterium]|nr:methyl-accepting chemotaxis protein [FCB group bacterium]